MFNAIIKNMENKLKSDKKLKHYFGNVIKALATFCVVAIGFTSIACHDEAQSIKPDGELPNPPIITPEENPYELTDYSKRGLSVFYEKINSLTIEDLEEILLSKDSLSYDKLSYLYDHEDLIEIVNLFEEKEQINKNFTVNGQKIGEITKTDIKTYSYGTHFVTLSNNSYEKNVFIDPKDSVWGITKAQLRKQDGRIIESGGVITTYYCDSNSENASIDESYVNLGDYLLGFHYDFENRQQDVEHIRLWVSSIYKITEQTLEEYLKQYGVDDMSLIGWASGKNFFGSNNENE